MDSYYIFTINAGCSFAGRKRIKIIIAVIFGEKTKKDDQKINIMKRFICIKKIFEDIQIS